MTNAEKKNRFILLVADYMASARGQGMYRIANGQNEESDIHFATENAWKNILKKALEVSDQDFSVDLFRKDIDNIV
jgi:hypothetical protein